MLIVSFLWCWVASLDALENLFSMHLYIFGCINADPHLHPLDAENGDLDVIIDNDAFADLSGEYQHLNS